MSDEPQDQPQEQPQDDHDEQPQVTERMRLLHQQAQDIVRELASYGVGASWGDVTNTQLIRPLATVRALVAILVAKDICTTVEAEEATLQAVVEDLERIARFAREQSAKAHGPQLALPRAPQLPPGILDLKAMHNGHRH